MKNAKRGRTANDVEQLVQGAASKPRSVIPVVLADHTGTQVLVKPCTIGGRSVAMDDAKRKVTR